MTAWLWHPDHAALRGNPDIPRGWRHFTQCLLVRRLYVLFWTVFFGLKVQGFDQVPKDKACVFISNHGSHYDGLLLYAGISQNDSRSLVPVVWYRMLDLPILGPILKTLWAVPINNEPHSSTLRMRANNLRRMIRHLRSGRHFFVLAEGHRSDTLGHFHSGAALAALQAGAPLVPVTLRGVQPLFKELDRFPKCFGTVDMIIHPPVYPAEAEGRKGEAGAVFLMAKVRASIASALDYPDSLNSLD
jgi:1-acyl-sn-glycerol-3-phosphate acyltransferase